MMSPLRSLYLATLFSLELLVTTTLAVECISNFEGNRTDDRGGRDVTDQKLAVWKESDGHAHLLCESGRLADGIFVRTTTEVLRGKIGFKSGWQSANPYGQIQFELMQVNGAEVVDGSISIDSAYESYKVCGVGQGGNPWQFDNAMSVINTLGGENGTQIKAYAFKNDQTKAQILAGEKLFSIDSSMLGCKLEIVVAIPVPSSGDLSFRVEVMVEHDTREAAINSGLTLNSSDSELRIHTDQETADSIQNGTAENRVIMTMSKVLVCAASKTAIDQTAITITNNGFPADSAFSYVVARSAISGCGHVYWDPLLSPFAGSSGGSGGGSGGAATLVSTTTSTRFNFGVLFAMATAAFVGMLRAHL